MKFVPNNLYHIYNQGNNQQRIFYTQEDYLTFIRLTRNYILPYSEMIAWCLMPNHFHFMIYADKRCLTVIKQGGILIDPITNGIRKLLSGYARIFNTRYTQTGSVFRQKTKSKCLTDIPITEKEGDKIQAEEYYSNCFHYIHQNPLRANLTTKMEEWMFSSFRDYAGLRKGTLCNKELAGNLKLYSPDTFEELSISQLNEKVINSLI